MSEILPLQCVDLKTKMPVPGGITAAQLVTVCPGTDVWPLMSEQENTRVSRILSERRQSALARTLAARRLWLADYLDAAPSDVILEHDEAGMPLLKGFKPGEVSFSRSEAWGAIALADGLRVGIDIEIERDIDWSSVLDFLSTPAEANRIRGAVEASGSLKPFFRAWCIKEAVLKLTGRGLKAGPKFLELPDVAFTNTPEFELDASFGRVKVSVTQVDAVIVALATTSL